MSRMIDLSRGDRVFHPDMKRVRYGVPDEIYPHVYHQNHHLPYDMPRGGADAYSTAQYHRTRPSYPIPFAPSEDTKAWAPSNFHAGQDSLTPVQTRDDTTSTVADPKPQDTTAHDTSDSGGGGEVSQDATHLLLTAASALTSLTMPSSFSAFNCRDEVSPSIEKQKTCLVSKDVAKKKCGRAKAIKFPVKLMNILSSEEYQDIVSWMPDGKAFMVKKPKAFVATILPVHFKEVKFSSFTRKLHRWGFTKMLRGKECGAYCHKDFQRGRMDLCTQMRCCDRDGLRATSEDVSLSSSSDAHLPQSSDRTKHEKKYPCQQARRESSDFSHHDKQDNAMRPYSHTMAMPMPQVTESFPGSYPTTYRPSSNYYEWNSWPSTSNNAGPSWDYQQMMRNNHHWQYPPRDHPMHRTMHSQNSYPSSQNM